MKRPSSGRGEYELAEPHEGINPGDLVGRELSVDLGPLGIRPTRIRVAMQGNKIRLRLAQTDGIHLARQLEAVLLLPKSIRDESRLPGGLPVLLEGRYLMRRMTFGSVHLSENSARISLRTLEPANQSNSAEEIDASERLLRVHSLHQRSALFLDPLNRLLVEHKSIVEDTEQPIGQSTERVVRAIMQATEDLADDFGLLYVNGEDCIPVLERMIGVSTQPPVVSMEAIEPEEIEIRRRQASQFLRWVNSRGADTARFRRSVQRAYRFTCAFCGLTLPRSSGLVSTGIDAAHILPWAEYDLDNIRNGIALCKLHHWAFDALVLTVSESQGRYSVWLTRSGQLALANYPPSLAEVSRACGEIGPERLPALRSEYPSPQLLERRASDLGIELVD